MPAILSLVDIAIAISLHCIERYIAKQSHMRSRVRVCVGESCEVHTNEDK